MSDLNYLGKLSMTALKVLHLVHWEEKKYCTNDKETYVECNNLTLINFVLIRNGPTHEATLTTILLAIQVCMCSEAFYFLNVVCGMSLLFINSSIKEVWYKQLSSCMLRKIYEQPKDDDVMVWKQVSEYLIYYLLCEKKCYFSLIVF